MGAMRIGMHVPGFRLGEPVAAREAALRGAETIQIFVSNPRQWRLPEVSSEADAQLRDSLDAAGVAPLFIHAPYLVNPASPDRLTYGRSRKVLLWSTRRAQDLGAGGLVVHAGSAVGAEPATALRRAARMISSVLQATDTARYLVELTAGGRGAVAALLPSAVDLLDACDGDPHIGLCLDTCHLHAAGYELSSESGVDLLVDELKSLRLLERLYLIHANDSRDPKGSRRDRHQHIGEGKIGMSGFRAMVRHRGLRNVPIVCETPGRTGDDRRNISRLKRMRDFAG